jgi:hypothetical protein
MSHRVYNILSSPSQEKNKDDSCDSSIASIENTKKINILNQLAHDMKSD